MSMVSELFSAANKMTPFRAHGGPDRRELLFLFGFDDLVASMAASKDRLLILLLFPYSSFSIPLISCFFKHFHSYYLIHRIQIPSTCLDNLFLCYDISYSITLRIVKFQVLF
ncbi:hypothetical protein Lalb_Chr01g0011201 [Lupinus albus]|uniref:Uncharacterized protein n=1 Tax=Lupinus albus TaxID=3870 RepID=A0A6A4R561_LUPAL|nr:hypothetical protein Lalb_Chr01g0011201 [Lupinus albus]